MTYRGDLILESLSRPELLPRLVVAGVRRVPVMHGPALPRLATWTLLSLEVEERDAAHDLAITFGHAADPGHLGWYLDLLGDQEHLFAFLGRVFTVEATAADDGYAEVVDFCVHRGIPADQLDFRRLAPAAG